MTHRSPIAARWPPNGDLRPSARGRKNPLLSLAAFLALLALLGGQIGCTAPSGIPDRGPTPLPSAPLAGDLTPIVAPALPTTGPATSTPQPLRPADLAGMLPEAFLYEVKLRPAGSSPAPEALIVGRYRAGAWQQEESNNPPTGTSDVDDRTATGPTQESIVVDGVTYTRPAGERIWTRWPGMGFDAAYGLTSPFTVLRLYNLADEIARGGLSQAPGAPEATFRVQAAFSAETIARLLEAGAAALAADEQTRAALTAQVAPLATPQTITYWVGEDGRIYRAAATILAADTQGQPAPWLEAVWRFWAYDDPRIAIAAPTEYREAPGPDVTGEPLPTALPQPPLAEGVNLAVRVFQSPGVPAQDLSVAVYPAGRTGQPLDWRSQADAQFTLPPGRYDVLVQMDYAQEWLRGITVKAGQLLNREVVFDFGTLELTVLRDGKAVPVDIVTYPAGNRQNWVDWRSDNPTTIRLRAGTYDVEIAYADYTATETVKGLVVRAGETTKKVVELKP